VFAERFMIWCGVAVAVTVLGVLGTAFVLRHMRDGLWAAQ
jgi:hypothetical protein